MNNSVFVNQAVFYYNFFEEWLYTFPCFYNRGFESKWTRYGINEFRISQLTALDSPIKTLGNSNFFNSNHLQLGTNFTLVSSQTFK